MKKLLVILLVLGLAVPAGADLVKFYGSVRTHLGYYDVSEEYIGGPAMEGTINGGAGGNFDDSGTLLTIGGQSRIGFVAKASDALSGVIEFGYRSDESVYLRLAYGTWNFGAGKLNLGKKYTPGTFLGYSAMQGDLGDNGDANMLVAGLAYIGRRPVIELQLGGFSVALIEPNQNAAGVGTYTDDIDYILPKIEAAYVFRTPVFSIRPVLGFQTYDAVDQVGTTDDDETITSYLLGLGGTVKLGPVALKATVSYLQNANNYGQGNVGLVNPLNLVGNTILRAQYVNGDVEDSTLLQGTFVVSATINQAFGIEAGVGYMSAEVDVAANTTAEQTAMTYYIQFPITLAKGVRVIPEIGVLDRGDYEVTGAADLDQGSLTYFDVNFRVDF